MKQIERITTNEEPVAIQRLGDGTYYYNYDIRYDGEVEKEGEKVPQWSFIQVMIYGYPCYGDCVKTIIRAYLDSGQEFELVNSYNKAIHEGQPETHKDIVAYFEFLSLLDEIKSKTREVFPQE